MTSGSLMDQAKAAISALSNPVETNRANAWLVDFERSAAAWEVSDSLVREENGSCRFFGAKFLYSKVQKQFIQLDSNSVSMLTQSLVQHILRISQESNVEFNICRYLCLALAALALQVNQSGILTQILQWLNPIISTNPNVLLELLIVLPEEAYNYQIDIASSARSGFIRQLTDSSNDVLSFLSSLWPSVGHATQAKILTCAAKWIDTTSMPSDMLIRNPIYMCILQSLESPQDEIFESAVDAMIVIFQRFRASDSRILESALPGILNLRTRWASTMKAIGPFTASLDEVVDDDRNRCRALCRIFTETAEAVMDVYLTSGASLPWQAELVNQLLECTKVIFDPSISRIPLKFFYDLAMAVRLPAEGSDQDWSAHSSNSALNETFGDPNNNGNGSSRDSTYNHSGSGKQGDAARRELNARYAPVYRCLLDVALEKLYVSAVALDSTKPLPEETLETRAEWKETVLDCCCVLGGPVCMDILCRHLQQLSANGFAGINWSQLESVLFAMQTVLPFLARDEAQYTPQVLAFLGTSLPERLPVKMMVTVVDVLGKYAFWLAANPTYVNSVLAQLFRNLDRPNTCAAAARAIMNVFRTCSDLPGLPVLDLHRAVLHMRNVQAQPGATVVLTLDSEILLLEAIMSVLSQMPTADSEAGFRTVLMPIVNSLAQGLQNASPANVSANTFTPDVDRLTVLFQFYRTPGGSFVVELFVSVLPLFQRLLDLCPTERVSEKCCRCYKHTLRNLGNAFVPYLSMMTTHLADQFARSPYSAFVYGCSTCFSTFSLLDNGAHVETLYAMLWRISGTFFATMPSLQHFEQKPDVVEEYFFLMAKALQYCPAPFLQYPAEAGTVVQAGLQGLSLRHREAQKGILLFFERFVQLSTFWPDQTRGSAGAIGATSVQAPTTNPLNLAARAMVQQYGAALLAKIFTLLSGEMPAYALDESNGCISDVMWYMKKRFKDEFQVWLRDALPGLNETAQKVAQAQQITETLSACKTLREFSAVLDRYELACRRNV